MKKENLNDIYLELLDWLEYEGKPSGRILHPLFYTYPWGLRFELGDPALDDKADYIRSALDRGKQIWDTVFAPDDEVLVIFDMTPEPGLKQALKHCRMQRVRAKCMSPWPDDDEEYEERYFYRYLYAAPAGDLPFAAILKRIVEGELFAETKAYSSAVYFYNRTKKLLFHPYDDRGADLIGASAEALEPFFESLQELLLDYDREEMARKFRPVRKVFLRILTTDTRPETAEKIREILAKKLRGGELTISELSPYWKFDGWGELNGSLDTARELKELQNILADHWESDTASSGIRLPGVGFLWIRE